MSNQQVDIDYIDRRGIRSKRRIQPVPGGINYDYNDYHSLPQWLLTAIDISGDGTLKTFAMTHIHSWVPVPSDP